MAQELPIAGGPETAKVRNVVAVALLPFVTFGIYMFVWYYKVNRELADLGRKNNREDLGTSPGKSLLAVTLGALIIVPAVISIINTYQRVKIAQHISGIAPQQQINGVIFALTYIFLGSVGFAYMQNELNKVWQIGAGQPLGGAAPAATFAQH